MKYDDVRDSLAYIKMAKNYLTLVGTAERMMTLLNKGAGKYLIHRLDRVLEMIDEAIKYLKCARVDLSKYKAKHKKLINVKEKLR